MNDLIKNEINFDGKSTRTEVRTGLYDWLLHATL